MSANHLIFLSIPGLRVRDIGQATTPTLYRWANAGVLAELIPSFPCVTSPVQASMWTGLPPGQHGVIANGFYHRNRDEVEFWVGRNDAVQGEQLWDAIRARGVGLTSAVWHAQNIKGAAADFIVTPAPIHEPDGTTKLWCYSKPDGLYPELLEALGHFPLQHYWGPLSNIESTRWILKGALWLIKRHAPNLHWIYIPHLDYASQEFGPNGPQAQQALVELDQALAEFADEVASSAMGKDVQYLVVGEYAMTDVSGVVYPNRVLREAGMVVVREDGALRSSSAIQEHVDLGACRAFAMVDHQVAHVYVAGRNTQSAAAVAELFQDYPGVSAALAGDARRAVGMDHDRAGDVILIADESRWFAYYWWLSDAAAPPYARTVDIHRKPGYDPVELFFDPATRGIPLDATLVKGSHGIPATQSQHRTTFICSARPSAVAPGRVYRDTDLKRITLDLLFST